MPRLPWVRPGADGPMDGGGRLDNSGTPRRCGRDRTKVFPNRGWKAPRQPVIAKDLEGRSVSVTWMQRGDSLVGGSSPPPPQGGRPERRPCPQDFALRGMNESAWRVYKAMPLMDTHLGYWESSNDHGTLERAERCLHVGTGTQSRSESGTR